MAHLTSIRPATDAPVTPHDVGQLLTNEQLAFAVVIGRELAEMWCADQTGDENTGIADSDPSVLENRF